MALTKEYREKCPRRTAAQLGFCIVCGETGGRCRCPSHTLDFIGEHPVTARPVYRLKDNAPCPDWHKCEGCGALLQAPRKTPAVRCPGCGFVN